MKKNILVINLKNSIEKNNFWRKIILSKNLDENKKIEKSTSKS